MHKFLPLLLLAGSCAAPPNRDALQTWGELRDVLREGQTQGRVELSLAQHPGCYGIGAIEGLAGEVVVLDGDVSVSRAASPSRVEPATGPRAGERATLLALADVESWSVHPMEAVADMDAFEVALHTAAATVGKDPREPLVFVAEGRLATLDAHVLNGSCPFASPAPEHEPYRARLEGVDVTLVGVLADGAEGVLTHHGRTSHVHVLTQDEQPLAAHVDELCFQGGFNLLLPRR